MSTSNLNPVQQEYTMKETSLRHYTADQTRALLQQIPFFTDLALHDFQQYELLLQNSCLIELDANEPLTKKGDVENCFYFLLEGQLYVFPDEGFEKPPISELGAGQVLGALAIINKQPRNASLAATHLGAKLLATDFTVFGEFEDFSQVKLSTKLSLLRIVVNNTRWKLQVYKMNNPEHPLAKRLDAIPQYTGSKGTVSELKHLAQQSRALGELLSKWNPSQQPIAYVTASNRKKGFRGLLAALSKRGATTN